MKNFVCDGDRFDVVASGTVAPGDPLLIGDILGIAVNGGVSGDTISYHVANVFSVPKATGAITQGAKLYWDDTAKNLTTTASGNTQVGWAFAAAASGDATVQFRSKVS